MKQCFLLEHVLPKTDPESQTHHRIPINGPLTVGLHCLALKSSELEYIYPIRQVLNPGPIINHRVAKFSLAVGEFRHGLQIKRTNEEDNTEEAQSETIEP